MDGKEWLEALLSDDLFAVRLVVRQADVVFVKGVLEASEGLGAIFAEPRKGASPGRDGGEIVIAAPRSQRAELVRTIRDLQNELQGAVWEIDPDPEASEMFP